MKKFGSSRIPYYGFFGICRKNTINFSEGFYLPLVDTNFEMIVGKNFLDPHVGDNLSKANAKT